MVKEVYSTFTDFCDTIDREMINQDASNDQYLKLAIQMYEDRKVYPNQNYIYDLLIKDFEHRARFRKNVIMSIEGLQGEGKSFFGLFWSYKLGEIFGVPFDIKKNLYAFPEELDEKLRESKNRTTHFLDEQRSANIGVGAVAQQLKLKDFEEQMRYTQKNIIYASPEVRDHAHYFVFEVFDMKRIENEDFKEFKDEKKLKFWEKSGYPMKWVFLLKTHNKYTKGLVPRGYVTVPMVTPETVTVYDRIKRKNLKKLERFQDNAFKIKQKLIKEFVKEYKEKCIQMIGTVVERAYKLKDDEGNPIIKKLVFDNRKYAVVSKDVIESHIYEFLGGQHQFTTRELTIMVSVSKQNFTVHAFDMNKKFFATKVKPKI